MGSPALADVMVTAHITKDKDVFVTQFVTKFKTVSIFVTQDLFAEGAAEADAIANQRNETNVVDGVDGIQGFVFGIKKVASISDSVNANQGIVGFNQDVSNMVNQGNLTSVALTNTGTDGLESSVTNSQAEAEQINGGTFDDDTGDNFVNHSEDFPVLEPLQEHLTANITDSINGNSGVVGVNQNAGNMNNQLNALAMAVGLGSKLALSEAALGQSNIGNEIVALNTIKSDTISGSVNDNSGVIGVNQSVGNMNNQASVVSMAVLTSTVAITSPGGN
jgi:hypothetical protein